MSKRASPAQAAAPPADAAEAVSVFNPVSKWQEYVEVPGLTLFDILRDPRTENPDPGARVKVPLKVRVQRRFSLMQCIGNLLQRNGLILAGVIVGIGTRISLPRLPRLHQEHSNCQGVPAQILQRVH